MSNLCSITKKLRRWNVKKFGEDKPMCWAYSASPGCERIYWFVKKWRGSSKSSFVPVALIESKLWMKSMNSAIYAKWFQRISLVKVWSVISYHIVIKPLYLKRKHACVGKLFRLHWRHSRPIMIGRRCFSRGLMGHSKTTLHRFGLVKNWH